jgi:plastocyanin
LNRPVRRVVFGVAAALCAASMTSGAPAGVRLAGDARVGHRGQGDVVVWLDSREPTLAAQKRVVLDQRNLDFFPHVLAVRLGTTVELPNNDRVFHNVFSFHNGKKFDLGLYPVGTVRYVTFDRPGLSRIFCNIHPNMAAYVMAVDTPYFAVSDNAGRFEIPQIPTGSYTYHAWRAGGADLTGSVDVVQGASLAIDWQ